MKKLLAVIALFISFNSFAGQAVTAAVQAFTIFMGEQEKVEREECMKTHTEQECRDGIKSGPVSNDYIPQTNNYVGGGYSPEPPSKLTFSIEQAKQHCKELGFKPKTEKFGNCVLELNK
jgi:hypothetical protein